MLFEAVYPEEINNKDKKEVWSKIINVANKEITILAAYQKWAENDFSASIVLQTDKVNEVLFEKDGIRTGQEVINLLTSFEKKMSIL